jgi:ribonuclease HI
LQPLFSQAVFNLVTTENQPSAANSHYVVMSFKTQHQHYNPRPRLQCVKEVHAFVDGSYSQGHSGYGAVIIVRERGIDIERNSQKFIYGGFAVKDNPELKGLSQMPAELNSCLEALQYAKQIGAHQVTIHFDCAAIEFWADETHLPRAYAKQHPIYLAYCQFVQKCRKHMQINFTKVSAHTGDHFNDQADALARLGRQCDETFIAADNPIPAKIMRATLERSKLGNTKKAKHRRYKTNTARRMARQASFRNAA